MIRTLIVLGAGGDLAARLLLPALAGLLDLGRLPDDLTLVGIDRVEQDDEGFRAHVAAAVGRAPPPAARAAAAGHAARCSYVRGDAGDPAAVRAALARTSGPVIAYLALPPPVFPAAIAALADAGLPEGSRVVIEKPFGQDLASARALNALLARTVPESAVHRIDHFLGKQTVQNILGLRFANRFFEPIWNREHVESVEIVWDETLALENRAGYYDRSGALRDMIENHLMQILGFIAMEAPPTLHERDLRDRKVDLLRAVRTPDAAAIARDTVRARYTAGTSQGRPVPDYAAEPGVDPARGTETFAQLRLWIDNWRWEGVPFVLRSGKALGELRQHVTVRFRRVPHLAFDGRHVPEPNTLRLGLDPDRVEMTVRVNGPGDPFSLEDITLAAHLAPQDVSAYGRIILDVIAGDPTLSIRGDEAEEAWRIVEPVLEAWAAGSPPLQEYPAGSSGPAAARATSA